MLKVIISKPGKKIEYKGTLMTSPCKFYIKEEEEMHMRVLLLKLGIEENSFEIVKCIQKNEIKAKNEEAEKENVVIAKNISSEVKSKQDSEKAKTEPEQTIQNSAPPVVPKETGKKKKP